MRRSETDAESPRATAVGTRVTDDDDRWLEQGEEYFAPARSMERADARVSTLVSSISLISAAAGGFALFGDAVDSTAWSRAVGIAALISALLAIVTALSLLAPSRDAEVKLNSPSRIADAFAAGLHARRRRIRLSLLFLAASVLCASATRLASADPAPFASITVTTSADEETLDVAAEGEHMPEGSRLRLTVRTRAPSGPLTYEAVSTPDATGHGVARTRDVPLAAVAASIDASIVDPDGGSVADASVELPPRR